MKNLGMMIAALVLAVLAGIYYWSNHRKPAADTTASSASASPAILTVPQADVSGITLEKKDSPEVVLAKSASGAWEITAPKKYGADQDSVNGILTTVSSLNADRVIDEKPSDLSQFGLKVPSLEVDVSLKGNQTKKLLIGDDSPAGGGAYAMLEGDPRVFTIASFNKTSIDKSLNDLRDKRFLTADFDKVTEIDLTAKKQQIEFQHGKDAWQIVKPMPARADGTQVDDLVQKLKTAKFDIPAADDAKKAASAFTAGTPMAEVKITGASGTQDLQVRKNKDDYYAKSTAADAVYKAPADLATALDKSVDDFRNKKLFDFGFEDPNKIEFRDGPKIYSLTHTGADWFEDGKKLDAEGVDNFVEKVRNLAAVKFPDKGFSNTDMQLDVTSNDNKRVEKVSISKTGDYYTAKRENEPELYGLSATDVTDLEKAAGAVKPAPPAPVKH